MVKIIINYICKDYNIKGRAIFVYIIGLIAALAALLGKIVFTQEILDSQWGAIPFLLLPIVIQLVALKHMRAWSKLANSATFNIIFYEDRFEYRGLISHKTIYYKDVERLVDLDLHVSGRGSSINLEIYQIETLDKKKIQLCCKKLSKENTEKLKDDLIKYTGITMDSKRTNFPKFK